MSLNVIIKFPTEKLIMYFWLFISKDKSYGEIYCRILDMYRYTILPNDLIAFPKPQIDQSTAISFAESFVMSKYFCVGENINNAITWHVVDQNEIPINFFFLSHWFTIIHFVFLHQVYLPLPRITYYSICLTRHENNGNVN